MSQTEVRAVVQIVEDEAIVAMDLQQHLIELGYRVCGIADNANQAIALARTYRPDVILMDIVIKGDRDGIQAADEIARSLHIPVVFLTAFSDAQTVERAARTSPYGYLTKPFQEKELRAAIEVALYKSKLERRLRESERWFSATLRCVADGVIATDPAERIRFMNPAAELVTGWSSEDAVGRRIDEVFCLQQRPGASTIDSRVRHAMQDNMVLEVDYGDIALARDGNSLPIDHSVAPIRSDDDQVMGAVIVFRNVSARMRAENDLRSSEARFRNAFDFAPVGMALVSLDGSFLQVNGALCTLLARSESELSQRSQFDVTHPADVYNERAELSRLLSGVTPVTQYEKRYRPPSGEAIWCLVSVSVLRDNDEPRCYLYQVHDLTERKEAEYQLSKLAHFDPLTGLANRIRLRDDAETMLQSARRRGDGLGILFLDLDIFKFINDTLGHEAGDQLLISMAERLKRCVRATDVVARLGGDEFVLLLGEIKLAHEISVVTQKILHALAEPWQYEGRDMLTSTSIGVAMYPSDAADIVTLFRHADSALYDAKAQGRNRVQFYRAELGARIQARVKLESELRQAVRNNEFMLFFQPIIDLSSGLAIGAEALVRWRHPNGDLIAPNAFIPLAEETGLIVAMGEWIAQEACREAVKWQQAGREMPVSINVSPRQFKAGNLVDVIQRALDSSGLVPKLLCVEITEDLVLHHSDDNLTALASLKAMGVTIAIDDFGVGYSSLSYIKRFSPRSLKIDQSFIFDVECDPENAVIVRAIIAMSQQLHIRVVAEGVETEASRRFLVDAGCEEAQGYFYARPCSGEQFMAWLATQDPVQ